MVARNGDETPWTVRDVGNAVGAIHGPMSPRTKNTMTITKPIGVLRNRTRTSLMTT